MSKLVDKPRGSTKKFSRFFAEKTRGPVGWVEDLVFPGESSRRNSARSLQPKAANAMRASSRCWALIASRHSSDHRGGQKVRERRCQG